MKLKFLSLLCSFIYVSSISAQELEMDEGDDMYGLEEVEMAANSISGNPQNFKIIDNTFFLKAVVGQMQYGDFWFDQNTKPQRILLPDTLKTIYPKAVLGDAILFAAYTPNLGEELWSYSKKDKGCRLVKDIEQGKKSSYIRNSISFKGKLYFQCKTKEYGTELWVSDGTAEGTKLVADVFKYDDINIKGILVHQDQIYYWTHKQLFVTNGEIGKATEIKLPEPEYFAFTTLVPTEKYVAITISGFNGKRLYKYIPKNGKVLLIKNWPEDNSMTNIWPEVVNDKLYFLVEDPTSEKEQKHIWTSDGTEKGTQQIVGKEGVEMNGISRLTAIGDKLYFTAFDEATGGNPWYYDTKTKSISKIADIFKAAKSPYPHNYIAGLDGKVYFQSGFDTRFLWITDGTAEGTKVLKKPANYGGKRDFDHMQFYNGVLYFNAKVSSTGENELWSTSGTEDSTKISFDF